MTELFGMLKVILGFTILMSAGIAGIAFIAVFAGRLFKTVNRMIELEGK